MSDSNLNDASFTPEINDSEESTNKQTYSATGSFRFWCQKVLPLVYDDSLSYYELLCKVVNYLNNVIQNVDNLNTSVDNTNTAFDNLQNYVNTTKDTLVEVYGKLEQYVNDYFNNLDVQEEINSKLDSMAEDGSLSTIILPFIPSAVADWLSENITPTSPAIDASLSVSGAGADAKVTGDRLSELSDRLENEQYNVLDILRFCDKPDYTYAGVSFTWDDDVCHVSGTATSGTGINLFASTNTLPKYMVAGKTYNILFTGNNVKLQIYNYSNGATEELLSTFNSTEFTVPSEITGLIIRLRVESGYTVDENVSPHILNIYNTEIAKRTMLYKGSLSSVLYPGADLNDFDTPSVYVIDVAGIAHAPLSAGTGILEIYGSNTIFEQRITFSTGLCYIRNCNNNTGTYSDWTPVTLLDAMQRTSVIETGNLNDYITTQYKFISSPNTVENIPETGAGFLICYKMTPTGIVLQEYHVFNNLNTYARKLFGNTWSAWTKIAGSNWLSAIDDETTLEANATDMTGAIMSMLTNTGYCKLSTGTFYVSGNIDMPVGSTIEGCGEKTVIRLLSSVENGYIIKAINKCTVKNLTLSGGKTVPTFSETTIRDGIHFARNESDTSAVESCILEALFIANFSGSGIYCNRTGGGVRENILATNIAIRACKYGLNIAFKSEYHKFTNILIHGCDTACINNGGNNIFASCTFNGNTGFVIDNSDNTLDNPGHGSCIGCTFNHIGNNIGDGVSITNNYVTFNFVGCQFWYGKINVIRSKGIIFDGCSFGGINPAPIVLQNNTAVLFTNNVFYRTPTINESENISLIFSNCYVSDTGAVVSV